MKQHKLNVLVLVVSVVVGYAILSWMTQQLDLMISPLVWQFAMNQRFWFPLFGWYGWSMLVPDAYVTFLTLIHVAYWISIIGSSLALWFWEEESIERA